MSENRVNNNEKMDNEDVVTEDTSSEVTEEGKKDKKGGLWYWIRDIVIAVVLATILLQFINPTMVRQESMMDTLHDGDYIFINKQAYRLSDVKRGDIIVFQTKELDENGKAKKLIKRAIALPGDTLEITGGEVYINGKELDEPYLREQFTDGEIEKTVVPENKIFAMGDNRAQSRDSRDPDIGLIDFKVLKGKAIFRIYPFSDIGTLE